MPLPYSIIKKLHCTCLCLIMLCDRMYVFTFLTGNKKWLPLKKWLDLHGWDANNHDISSSWHIISVWTLLLRCNSWIQNELNERRKFTSKFLIKLNWCLALWRASPRRLWQNCHPRTVNTFYLIKISSIISWKSPRDILFHRKAWLSPARLSQNVTQRTALLSVLFR